jgi:hypothetical protein
MTPKQELRAKALEIAALINGPLTDVERAEYPNDEYAMQKYRGMARIIERLIKEADPDQT